MYTERKLKIVLIDDDPQMREMLNDFLKGRFPESQIDEFATGEHALLSIANAQPDVIILDYHLDSADPAAMNGIQVLRKIKDYHEDVPVIFLTSQDKTEIAANTMKYGAWDYILKNEHAFNRLEIIINNIIGHTDLRKNLGTQKFFNRLLAVLLVALVIGFIIIRLT